MDANSFIIFISLFWMDSILAGELTTLEMHILTGWSHLCVINYYRYQYIKSTSCEAAKVLLWDRIKIGSVRYFNTFHCFRREAVIIKLLTFPPIRHSLHVVLYDDVWYEILQIPIITIYNTCSEFCSKRISVFLKICCCLCLICLHHATAQWLWLRSKNSFNFDGW